MEVVRQLPEVLDQALPLLSKLLDVRVDLLLVCVGLLADPACVGGSLGADLLGTFASLQEDFVGLCSHLGAVTVGLLASLTGLRLCRLGRLLSTGLRLHGNLIPGLPSAAEDRAGLLADIRERPLDDGIGGSHRLEFHDDPRHPLDVLVNLRPVVSAARR